MEKAERITIQLVTNLSDDIASLVGVEKLQNMQAKTNVASFDGSIAVLPKAGCTVRRNINRTILR